MFRIHPYTFHTGRWKCLTVTSPQSCEEDEAFMLLQLSKEEQTATPVDQEDEELIVAEYESDDESKSKSR